MRFVLSNTIRTHVLLGAGCCCGSALWTLPAYAESDPAHFRNGAAALLAMNFDLAGRERDAGVSLANADANGADRSDDEHVLEEPVQPRRPWVDDSFTREWTIQPDGHGPALEVAALGGGQKKSGKLAHVRVSWAF